MGFIVLKRFYERYRPLVAAINPFDAYFDTSAPHCVQLAICAAPLDQGAANLSGHPIDCPMTVGFLR